ncbi:MAG: hypothetical protein AAF985_10785, partial [Bacteroidota bacterium]
MENLRTTIINWIWKHWAFRFTSLLLFGLFTVAGSAQVQTQWSNNLGGTQNDWLRSGLSLANQEAVLVGTSYSSGGDLNGNGGRADAWIIKVDDAGQLLWSQSYGGSGQDEWVDIQATNDGGYVLYGQSNSTDGDVGNTMGGFDLWLLKIDANGQIEWSQTYGGRADERASKILLRPDGQFYLLANSFSSDFPGVAAHRGADAWLLRIDVDGELIGAVSYAAEGTDWLSDGLLLSNGNLLLAGYSNSSATWQGNPRGAADGWLYQVDANGQVLWSRKYGGDRADFFKSLTASTTGIYTLAGYTYSGNGNLSNQRGKRDAWAIQVDAMGNTLWSKNFGGSHHDEFSAIQSANDALYLTGYTWSNDGDITQPFGNKDVSLYKINLLGDLLWQINLGGSQSDEAAGLLIRENEKILLYGCSRSDDEMLNDNKGLEDAWLVLLAEVNDNFSVDLGGDQQVCAGASIRGDATTTA